VTVDAPCHKITVDHFRRSIGHAGNAVADRAVDLILNMDPVGKDDERRELIHPFPWDRLAALHISDDFQSLGPLADGVARMAGLAEFDIRDPSDTIPFHMAMTEGAVQVRHLLVMDVIESDGLIDRDPGKNGEDRIKDAFSLSAESIVSHSGKQRDEDENNEKIKPFLHITNLLKRVDACQEDSIAGLLSDRTGLHRLKSYRGQHSADQVRLWITEK
jgi:hypothetical protein